MNLLSPSPGLIMKVSGSSYTSVYTYYTTGHYISQNSYTHSQTSNFTQCNLLMWLLSLYWRWQALQEMWNMCSDQSKTWDLKLSTSSVAWTMKKLANKCGSKWAHTYIHSIFLQKIQLSIFQNRNRNNDNWTIFLEYRSQLITAV